MRGSLLLLLIMACLHAGVMAVWAEESSAPGAPPKQKKSSPLKRGKKPKPPQSGEAPTRSAPLTSGAGQAAPPASTGSVPQSADRAGENIPPVVAPPNPSPPAELPKEPGPVTFSVNEYAVEGNTLVKPEKLEEVLGKFKGTAVTVEDLEKARVALEKTYHDLGYPTVLVVLPEQTVEQGTVRMNVVESKLSGVTVSGNRYYSEQNVLSKLPSFKVGALLHEPTVVKEIDAANSNPDRQVAPVMKPGKDPGTVDVELKVKDRLPLHARLSADNRGPLTTPSKRMIGEVQYTNLFDRDHILTLQTTQTPDDFGAVQSYGFTYVAPIQWPDHLLSVYASTVKSNSVLAGATLPLASGDIGIAGNAKVAGFRYSFPLGGDGRTTHTLSVGADYKRLEKTTATFPGELGTAVVLSPIQYTPVSVAYTMVRPDSLGFTRFSTTLKGYVPVIPGGRKEDFAGDPADPDKPGNRAGSSGNFGVFQGAIDREVALPRGFTLSMHVDGQWATEPLIPAEQYFAGGMDTVRGYVQFETIGDHAILGKLELLTPKLQIPFDRFYLPRVKADVQLAGFYDGAGLWIRNALPGQQDRFRLEGIGAGVRVTLFDQLKIRLDQAWAQQNATVTQKNDSFVHFSIELPL